MFQIDNATASPTLPAPAAPGTPGYFTKGNPAATPPVPATILDQDYMNMLMMEIINVILAAGGTLSKTTYTQLRDAINSLIASGGNNPFLLHASASTCDIGAAVSGQTSTNASISGTTAINSFGSSASMNRPIYFIYFGGALTLNNSAALALPNAANTAVAAGSYAIAVYLGSGNWKVLSIIPAQTSGSNGNGNWMIRADGRLDQDGASAALPTGANTATVAVTFPVPFTSTTPPRIQATPDADPDLSGHIGMGFEVIPVGSAGNWTGCTINVATLDISISFAGTIHMMWHAIG